MYVISPNEVHALSNLKGVPSMVKSLYGYSGLCSVVLWFGGGGGGGNGLRFLILCIGIMYNVCAAWGRGGVPCWPYVYK